MVISLSQYTASNTPWELVLDESVKRKRYLQTQQRAGSCFHVRKFKFISQGPEGSLVSLPKDAFLPQANSRFDVRFLALFRTPARIRELAKDVDETAGDFDDNTATLRDSQPK